MSGVLSYQPKDFAEMTLNPFVVPDGVFMQDFYEVFKRRSVFKTLPQNISKLSEKERESYLWNFPDLDMFLRYIVIFIDPESPMYNQTDFDYKKKQALMLLEVEPGSNVHNEIESEGRYFFLAVFEFFKIVNDLQYEEWFSQKINFHHATDILRQPIPVTDTSAINARRNLATSLPELRKTLLKLQASLFKDKRTEKMIVNMATEDSVGGYAEEFAEYPDYMNKQQT